MPKQLRAQLVVVHHAAEPHTKEHGVASQHAQHNSQVWRQPAVLDVDPSPHGAFPFLMVELHGRRGLSPQGVTLASIDAKALVDGSSHQSDVKEQQCCSGEQADPCPKVANGLPSHPSDVKEQQCCSGEQADPYPTVANGLLCDEFGPSVAERCSVAVDSKWSQSSFA